MAFVEVQFPTDISYGSSGGPEYATDIVATNSGYEQRNINWAQARALQCCPWGEDKSATGRADRILPRP